MKIKCAGILFATLLGGCSTTHLVYVQETSMGLNVAVGAEGMQKMSLGYDRDVLAIVPKKGKDKDAMALFSVNNVRVEGLDNMDVSEFVATGEPAKKIASDDNMVSTIRSEIYGK
ncbi:hypothetical protein [Thalassotalea sp. PLHSN55]|uniref:hypothetical protein n=1 Tax=Thalassotalea sp. PLHSN55 TaxID=3435888 RepID=UPI003F83FB9C